MKVGVPAEVKTNETRVGITPSLVARLVDDGHQVNIQRGAGVASGLDDLAYEQARATLCDSADDVWSNSDLIVKVKEPIAQEFGYLRPDLTIFSFLHLAAAKECEAALLGSGCTAIAFETVQNPDGSLPLLAPMSQVAGRVATQIAAGLLTSPAGGRGVLLGGVDEVPPANVTVIGGGVAGSQAADVALGLGAKVTLVDRDLVRVEALRQQYVSIGWSERIDVALGDELDRLVPESDLVVCAALVAGKRAPVLVTAEMVQSMHRGSVVTDIAIDQGGNCELSEPTTHADPAVRHHDVLITAITNLPAAVPRTSTFALAAVTGPYIRNLANLEWEAATSADETLRRGLSITAGRAVRDID